MKILNSLCCPIFLYGLLRWIRGEGGNDISAGIDQSQKTAGHWQSEIRMQFRDGICSIFAGSEDHNETVGHNGDIRKNPLFQVAGVRRKKPAVETQITGGWIVDFDPRRIVAIHILDCCLIGGHELGNFA